MNAIQTHQPDRAINTTSIFNVCIRHFKESDYTKQKADKFKLNLNAIPTIFENELQSPESTIEQNQVANEAPERSNPSEPVSFGEKCTEINRANQTSEEEAKLEIKKLNSEIFKLKLDHDVKIQQLQAKIEFLTNKLDEKTKLLHTARNEIDRKKCTIERLEEVNATLRKNHIAADISNVKICVFYSFYYFGLTSKCIVLVVLSPRPFSPFSFRI